METLSSIDYSSSGRSNVFLLVVDYIFLCDLRRNDNSHNKAKDASTIEHWFGTYFHSYPKALPDFHFHLSLGHMSYIAIRVGWVLFVLHHLLFRSPITDQVRKGRGSLICGDSQLNTVQHHVRRWKRDNLQETRRFPVVGQLFSRCESVFWNKIAKKISKKIALCQNNFEKLTICCLSLYDTKNFYFVFC